MKVMVVGCKGMLGTDLIGAFRAHSNVVGLDLPDIDIGIPEQCLAKASEVRPDVIINAAALTQVDACEARQEDAFRVNGHGAGNLARAAAETGSYLVHYSTDYIFDGRKEGPYLENDAPNPQSVYGRSKLLGEELVRRYCPDHAIIRTSWLFGRNGANFIRTILNAALNGTPLRVVNDQRGSPTYSKDLAFRTVRLVEKRCLSTFHITNSGYCTWYELALQALEWAGIRDAPVASVSTSEFPRPAPRPANSVLANARLEREGFPPMRPWAEAAREYVEHLREERDGRPHSGRQ